MICPSDSMISKSPTDVLNDMEAINDELRLRETFFTRETQGAYISMTINWTFYRTDGGKRLK